MARPGLKNFRCDERKNTYLNRENNCCSGVQNSNGLYGLPSRSFNGLFSLSPSLNA